MKFLDEAGKPSARYHSFLDDTQWKRVLADGIREAFPDLFRVNRNANSLPRDQLAGKIKSLSEGKVSPAVLANTTKTFVELVKLADFSASQDEQPLSESAESERADEEKTSMTFADGTREESKSNSTATAGGPTLVYRIEIVLPAVRDQSIYDAIFRSAKEHLLK